MPLKTTSTFPPGGFPYTQAETGFKVASMMPFNTVAQELARHRQANNLPRATRDECAEDIEAYTCQRLGNDPRYCVTNVKKNPLAVSRFLSASPQHVRNLVKLAAKVAHNLGSGSQILADWLGDGLRPVSPELSQSRADICTGRQNGKPCSHNRSSPIIDAVTKPVASAIQAQLQKKSEVGAKVEGEENLKTCEVCWCNLPLKVHTPLDTIVNRTPDAMLKKFPSHCWLVKERQNTTPA